MKSWSCCGIQTLDFGAFLAQPGCRVGRHDWGKQVSSNFPELLIRIQLQKWFFLPAPRSQALLSSPFCMDQIRHCSLSPNSLEALQYKVVLIFLRLSLFHTNRENSSWVKSSFLPPFHIFSLATSVLPSRLAPDRFLSRGDCVWPDSTSCVQLGEGQSNWGEECLMLDRRLVNWVI